MTALDDLREHPIPRKPWLIKSDPDARSFHEVICDLARQAMYDPSQLKGLPEGVTHALANINDSVVRAARALREAENI